MNQRWSETWIQTLVLALITYMTLGKLPDLSELCSFSCKNGINNILPHMVEWCRTICKWDIVTFNSQKLSCRNGLFWLGAQLLLSWGGTLTAGIFRGLCLYGYSPNSMGAAS